MLREGTKYNFFFPINVSILVDKIQKNAENEDLSMKRHIYFTADTFLFTTAPV